MSVTIKNKVAKDTLVKNVERHYGVSLGYATDAELHKSLKERGLPTLSKLLKQTRFAK